MRAPHAVHGGKRAERSDDRGSRGGRSPGGFLRQSLKRGLGRSPKLLLQLQLLLFFKGRSEQIRACAIGMSQTAAFHSCSDRPAPTGGDRGAPLPPGRRQPPSRDLGFQPRVHCGIGLFFWRSMVRQLLPNRNLTYFSCFWPKYLTIWQTYPARKKNLGPTAPFFVCAINE